MPGYEPGARCLDVRQLVRELETGEERERPRAQGREVVLDLVAVSPPEDVVDRVVVVGLRRGRRLDGGAGREDGHGIVDGTDCCRRPRAAIVVVVGRGVDPRDLPLFRRTLCQLSYPTGGAAAGEGDNAVLTGFEPAASTLTGWRSLQTDLQDRAHDGRANLER